ncbi:hypothetical protein MKX01_010945 [Papaver californicum]|nr:hypothetical protein MKX01_010945 [Papaver californicum]
MVDISSSEGGGGGGKRFGCLFGKDDFFPEESFQSWSNYMKALGETKTRLRNRLTTRSSEKEVNAMTERKANRDAGPAVVISFLISGFSAMLCVFCYTEFACEIPVAGGSFAFIRVELGDFLAFIAAGKILVYCRGSKCCPTWTSYCATLLNYKPDDFRIHVRALPENYDHLDPLAVVIPILIGTAACLSTKASSRFNFTAAMVNVVVILLFIIAGLTKANPENFTANFAPNGPRGVFTASAVFFFSYIGFDADIPIGLLGSMSFIIVIYCALSATLWLMQSYTVIDVSAPYSLAFEAVGMKWVKILVAVGAVIAINQKAGTPIHATIVMTLANCFVGFFTDLGILSNLLSIATLFIFTLVVVSLLVRRYYVQGETTDSDRNKFIGLLLLIQARKPKLWGVPLISWLPALSIAMNMFLLGSLDAASFIRFGIWTGILLLYYFFVGLHASYDSAKELADRADKEHSELGNVEAGRPITAVSG